MNKLPGLLSILMLISCTHNSKPASTKKGSLNKIDVVVPKGVSDTAAQLEAFLDSIGRLPQRPLMDKVAFEPDSVFRAQKQLDTLISPGDFETLKRAAQKGVMRVDKARRIFKNNEISYTCNEESVLRTYKIGFIPVKYYPSASNKNDFKEFALCIGDDEHCPNAYLYFFSGNRIIARHKGYSHYGLDLKYYKDLDGKTVVYYIMEFSDGSGEWWNNFFFYKYDGNRLIPILDELQNGNAQPPAPRGRWLESFVQNTHPLTIKMVYYQNFNRTISLPDTTYYESSSNFINDSTVVRYAWDEQTKTFKGNYEQSKLSKAQIMSYYLADNDYLFLNAYYPRLKRMLKDNKQRKWVLWYLQKMRADRTPKN